MYLRRMKPGGLAVFAPVCLLEAPYAWGFRGLIKGCGSGDTTNISDSNQHGFWMVCTVYFAYAAPPISKSHHRQWDGLSSSGFTA